MRRTGSVHRVNRTDMAGRPVRSPALAVRSRRAADPAGADSPNPAAAAAVPLAERTATHRAARDAEVGPPAAADPKREPEGHRTHHLAEAAARRDWRAPVERVLRTRDKICSWAGSELHSEHRRSFERNSRPRACPCPMAGKRAQHSRPFPCLEQQPLENRARSCPSGAFYASFSSWTRAALPSRSRR